MQPIEFIQHAKQYLEYSDRKTIATDSNLNISKIYHLLNNGKGKKNSLIISLSILKLIKKKGIKDKTISQFEKKFANPYTK